ncbi:MAG: rRNA maturation RNase YbeY [Spartobacteria bacterium]
MTDSPRITVRKLQRAIRVNVSALSGVIGAVLAIQPKKTTTLRQLEEVSVLLISDRRMTALHRQFLHQDGPTDVITFDHGEIFISVETARKNARRFGNSLIRELQLCLIHGLLHLHDFDDRTPAEARRMRQTQEKILARMAR